MIQDSSDFQKKHTALLFLPVFSGPGWYLKKIAGVPFFLRNIFTLQNLGFKKLIVWAEQSALEHEKFLDLIKTDKRLQLELNWVDKISFYSISGASSFLIFDGSNLLTEFGSHIVQMNAENSKLFPEQLVQCLGNKEVYFFKSKRQEEQKRLLDEKDFCEAEEGLLKSCGLDNDSFMDRLVTRFISRQLTPLFLKTSLPLTKLIF